MAGQKVKLKDTINRVVRLGSDGAGATVGKDLRWPDGTVAKASDIRNPTSDSGSTGSLAATVWKLIREIPANIQKLAKLVGSGFTTRGPDGEWYQRSIEEGEGVAVTNGNGVDGNPTVALAELANAGGGALQKTQRDDYGRVAGTSQAVLADLADVSPDAPVVGSALQWTGSQWEPKSIEIGVSNLDGGRANSVYGGTTAINGGGA